MDPVLPQEDSIESIQKSIKKYGWLKTTLYQFLAHWPSFLIALLLIFSQGYNVNRFRNIEKNINNNSNVGNVTNVKINEGQVKISDENSNILGKGDSIRNATFNPDDWIISGFDKDNEGYYCPQMRGYNYWSIWSKKKFPVSFSVTMRLSLKSKNPKKVSPIILTYGEYIENFGPKTFYRISFFDSNERAIRLYDENNKPVGTDWIKERPNLNNEIKISISPLAINPISTNKIIVNQSVIFNSLDTNKKINLDSSKELSTIMPSVDIGDSSFKKQLGIGTTIDSCFKPIFIEFL